MIARQLLEGIGGYSGLFFFCMASGIVLPVPEDVALIYAGMRVESGEAAWLPTVAVAIPGVLARDAIAYALGRLLGEWVLEHALVRRVVGERRLRRARALVERHGSGAVIVGRFLVGLRAPIFLVCGASGVSARRFLGYDLAGLLVAVPAALILGSIFGQPLIDGFFWVVQRGRLLMPLVAATLVVLLLWRVSDAPVVDDEA